METATYPRLGILSSARWRHFLFDKNSIVLRVPYLVRRRDSRVTWSREKPNLLIFFVLSFGSYGRWLRVNEYFKNHSSHRNPLTSVFLQLTNCMFC